MGAIVALVAVVGLVAWGVSPVSPFAPKGVPTPAAAPTPVARPATNTPGLVLMGAATFTSVPGRVVSGPHVLGITAGVGMRAGEIAGAAPIAVSFSDDMDHTAAQSAFAVQPATTGEFRWQGKTLFFTPKSALAPATDYTVSMGAEAKTSVGKVLAEPVSLDFTTAPPPAILRTLPSAGASEVPTDTIVTITFNRPMIPLTALDSHPDPGEWVRISPPVPGRWVWLGTSAVGYRAAQGFRPSTQYTVEARTGWPDNAGITLDKGVTFSFTTIKPAIVSIGPYNGVYDIPIDAPVVVRFNQPMDHSTSGAFRLTHSDTQQAVAGNFTWSADSTVMTFTAGSLLDFFKGYRATFAGQVIPAGGSPVELAGGQSTNLWVFQTTATTRVISHNPEIGQTAYPTSSFGFNFNNPLAPGQDVARYLTIDPRPEGYKGQLEWDADLTGVYTDGVQLLPNTRYRFHLRAGLRDKWGYPVQPSEWTVAIGPLPPNLNIAGGGFVPVYVGGPSRVKIDTANLETVTLTLNQLSEAEMHQALRNPPGYDPNGVMIPGRLLRVWSVNVPKGQLGQSTIYPVISARDGQDRLPAGFYILKATAPTAYDPQPLTSMVVLVVGRAGAVVKSEGKDLLVWVADLATGKPVPGYSLRVEQMLANDKVSIKHVQTGQDGLVRLTLDDENSMGTSIWSEMDGEAMLAIVGWSNGVTPPYNGGGYYPYYGQSQSNAASNRSAVYTDRPIYRPGQTVSFRGVYRRDDDASYTLPKNGAMVQLRAGTYGGFSPFSRGIGYGGSGQTSIYTGTANLSPIGTFNGQFTIPADAPVGTYTLEFSPPDSLFVDYPQTGSVQFDVQEYRKPDFQVNVSTRENAVHGDPVTATVQTSYYFGGPLANITATINLMSTPYYFSWSDPDTGEWYTFGDGGNPRLWYDYYSPGGTQPAETPIATFETRTDRDGFATVDASRYVTTTDSSKTLVVEAQVQDLSNQAVANSASVVVHQGQYYVGLAADYIATAKQATTIVIRTVDASGKSVRPNTPVNLRLVRRDWTAPRYSFRDVNGNGGDWSLNEVEVAKGAVTTDAKGRATYQFTPPTGGDYGIIAEGTDSRGNRIKSSTGLWVSSEDWGYSIPWRFKSDQEIKMVADKKEYKIGDTARILVTSPYTQGTGLLTLERGHLKRYRVVDLRGGAPVLEVKIEAGDVPNVYASLVMVGKDGKPVQGAPAGWPGQVQMRQGYVDLPVDTSGQKLGVSIEPQGKTPFQPGTTATLIVRTKDLSGKPRQGEVSLAVVDEAIFALSDDKSGSLFDTFWAERGVSVQTSSNFSGGNIYGNIYGNYYGSRSAAYGVAGGDLSMAAPAAAIATGGGSGASSHANMPDVQAAPKKVRADFRDTAFWQGSVVTGSDGSATVSVPLPDNLTTWRLTAQGVAGASPLLGVASVPMTVTQPLLLRPVQPRFMTTGDNPHPQTIVHNNTDAAMQIEASLEVSGSITLDAQPPAAQRVSVPAHEQAVVTWSATVGKGDVAHLRYWVHTVDKSGSDYLEDAISAHLPVKAFAAPEAVATSGEVDGTRTDESVFLPYSVNPLLGELIIQVSPSLAAASTESLRYVEEYPYESTDQTVSRFLPLVTLEKVYKEQGLAFPYSADLPGIVSRAMRRLAELQQPDGGWGWWSLGPSNWWDTAYTVQGLAAAREAGYAVPDGMFQVGVQRLEQYVQGQGVDGIDETYHLNMRAYTLYVLSHATPNAADGTGEGTALVGQVSRMSTHGRAWLAMALDKLGMKGESKQVLDSLAASARQSSTTAHWEEGTPDYWSMGTDTRATALAIDALVTLAPGDPLVPKAVRWLMTAEKDGHWLSTQETSISLIALAHYMRQSKELQADYSWQVSAFDKELGQGIADSKSLTRTVTMRLPVSDMPKNEVGDLALARSGDKGKMYYQVSLRYYVPGDGIQSRSEGMAITRSYFNAEGPGTGEPVKDAKASDLLKVRLTLVITETSHYVMVTDPLPAGLEGVNGSLNTTSFTERPTRPAGYNVAEEGPGGYGRGYYDWWWYRWGPFSNVEMRDDRTVLFADYISPGTYVYEYYARATTPGTYMALPAHAELMYYPDVFGHSDGGAFTVR
jgi:uncharacterized protein YfaS (alpha-2-macroglobulin family)